MAVKTFMLSGFTSDSSEWCTCSSFSSSCVKIDGLCAVYLEILPKIVWNHLVEKMSERTKCTIDKVHMKDHKLLQPVLVTFQHGTLEPEAADGLKCSVSRLKSSGKRVYSVATQHNGIRYTGTEATDTNKFCRTMIAIRNRKTNKVRLIETENVLLSPIVSEDVNPLKIELEYADKYANLQKSFGSKTVRRRTEQQERSKTDVNTLKTQLMKAISGIELDTAPSVDTSSLCAPPCNRSATSVDDVYKLHDLITKEELASMENKAKQVLANANKLNTKEYTLFFHENLPKVLARDKDQLLSLEVMLYLDCLIKFFNAPYRPQMLKSTCSFSLMVTDKILREFTMESSTKRLRPSKMKDKAACHIIVLCLLIFNYKFDLVTIVNSTKESIKRLTMFSRAIGASKSGKDGSVIELKLPLAMPYEPMGSKKGSKRTR